MAGRGVFKMTGNVAIVGGDVLTPLGDLEQTWASLLAGRSGLVRQKWASVNPEYPLGLIPGTQGHGTSWERLNSLLEMLLPRIPQLAQDTPLFLATTKGAIDEYLTVHSTPSGQPWQLAEIICDRLGLAGETKTVSAACASGTLAVIQASLAILTGKCSQALVLGVDLVGDFILTGFDSLKALSITSPKPFDKTRDGLALGDGAGWILLSAEAHVDSTPLAWIGGWGISCDATHITAPCRKAGGLKRTISQVLGGSRSVGGINAHGTGTVYNDAMELVAFNDLCAAGTPVCSVKGALGHSLGAAGVVETLLSVKSVHTLVLPPTVGLEHAETSNMQLSGTVPLQLLSPSVLSCNSGFGGINGAVLLNRDRF